MEIKENCQYHFVVYKCLADVCWHVFSGCQKVRDMTLFEEHQIEQWQL